MVKNRKKEGSTLITVLAVSLIFMALSGIILKSMSSTMKSNTKQKEVEDLRYAAESGLEIARSYIESNTINDLNNAESQIERKTDMLKNSSIKNVNINLEEIVSNGKRTAIKVKSEAENFNSKSESVNCRYDILGNGNANIYDYGLVAGQGNIDINNNGSLGIQVPVSSNGTTSINGVVQDGEKFENNSFEEIKFVKNTNFTETITLAILDENKYPQSSYPDMYKYEDQLGKFKFYDLDNKKQLPITKIKIGIDLNGNIESFILNGDKIEGDFSKKIEEAQKESIISIEVNKFPVTINMIVLNTDNFDLNLVENSVGQTLHLSKTIITTKGNINMIGNGALTLDYSTLYGNSINIDKDTSISISTVSGTEGHGIGEKDEKVFNEIFGMFISNWDKENGLSTSGIKLNENSFSNN